MIGPLSLLEGEVVRLEPLRANHYGGFCQVGLDLDLWRWAPQQVLTREAMTACVKNALRGGRGGEVH